MGLLERATKLAMPLADEADLDPLLRRAASARVVLLGEASHGTHEFYEWRARISQRLIREHGFGAIAVEGDWPDCDRLHRYVARGEGGSAEAVLLGFSRWPAWMWANREIAALGEWMRSHVVSSAARVGFFGLDVYSLWDSLRVLADFLPSHDGETLERLREAIACFEGYGVDAEGYARAVAWTAEDCEEPAVRLLAAVRERAGDDHDWFSALQNARAVVGAEAYYRSMLRGGGSSWNLRDRHMMATLEHVLERYGRAIVWAHNTHVGDARFTDMARSGLLNIGQLARERFGDEQVCLVGFTSHRGSLIAGEEWGAPMERMPLPPAREGSWDELLHRALGDDALLVFEDPGVFGEMRDQRAVGVVFQPQYEAFRNYVPTALSRRYDALLHVDQSHALLPLHPFGEVEEAPETWPTGL